MSARPAAERRAELLALYHELRHHRCPLADTRTNVVFGSGNADADLMFVGEAPGANEDRQGLPFVGNAGKLLDRLLGEIGLERADTFITNVLMCRPPGNRDPLPEEIEECTPHLMRRIELVEPRVICTLGNFSLKLLSGARVGITKVHGVPQEREVGGRTVILYPLFHPAAALRTPAVLDLLREDMVRLPTVIEEAAVVAGPAPKALAPPSDAVRGTRGGPLPADEPNANGPTGGDDQLGLFA